MMIFNWISTYLHKLTHLAIAICVDTPFSINFFTSKWHWWPFKYVNEIIENCYWISPIHVHEWNDSYVEITGGDYGSSRLKLNSIFNTFHTTLLLTQIFLFDSSFVDPPEITKRPINQSVRVGGVASFYCAARGDPIPSIVWRKNGKKVSGTQSRYSVTQINGQSILRIEPVRAGRDDAPYECVAENGVGDAVSAEATLSVFESKYHISINSSIFANSIWLWQTTGKTLGELKSFELL